MNLHLNRILEEPKAQDLFWVLRVAETTFNNKPRIGSSKDLRNDVAKLDQIPTLAFPASAVESIDFVEGQNSKPALHVMIYSFGIWGSNGIAPLAWTEWAYNRIKHHNDLSLTSFCGIFHNRMTALWYKAWASSEKTVDADRPNEQQFLSYIGSLGGVDALDEGHTANKMAKVYYSGLFNRLGKDPNSIALILSEFFRQDFRIEEFLETWVPTPESSKTCLGISNPNAYGMGAIGDHFLDCQMKFRIVLGPLSAEKLNILIMNLTILQLMKQWIDAMVGAEFIWDLQVLVNGDKIPQAQLGNGISLGRNTWVTSRKLSGILDDIIIPDSCI